MEFTKEQVRPRSRKQPVIAESGGKQYVWPADTVARLSASESSKQVAS